ncbi:MAG: hypothetical protein IT577_21690 [Verrucomicrobiae bacterium]|nr:hypothetical protein [Verrucomicrobiae bacterium]
MKWAIGFMAGMLAGALLVMALRPDRSAELAAARAEAKKASDALAVTQQRLAKVQASSVPPALASPELKPAVPEKPGAAKKGQGPAGMFNEKFMKAVGEMAQSQVKVQMRAKLDQIVERLGLTSDQEAKLRGLVEPQIDAVVAQVTAAMEGKEYKADAGTAATAIQAGKLPPEVEATLTPEQKAAYDAFKQEEKANRIETRASAELMGLQAMGLTQEQKDRAFEAFCRLAEEDEDAMSKATSSGEKIDMKGQMDRMMGRRVEALRDVLTEPQLKGYEAQVELQRKMMSEMGIGIKVAPGK